MLQLNEIKDIIQSNKSYLESNYNISKIGIFGSYANSKNNENSDIDILVDFNINPGLVRFLELEEYLKQITNSKIDLVTINSLNKRIKESIINEVIYL